MYVLQLLAPWWLLVWCCGDWTPRILIKTFSSNVWPHSLQHLIQIFDSSLSRIRSEILIWDEETMNASWAQTDDRWVQHLCWLGCFHYFSLSHFESLLCSKQRTSVWRSPFLHFMVFLPCFHGTAAWHGQRRATIHCSSGSPLDLDVSRNFSPLPRWEALQTLFTLQCWCLSSNHILSPVTESVWIYASGK